MQNEAMNLYKEITEKTANSVKKLGELNLRTFETLATKQIEIMQGCVDTGVTQANILADVKDVKDVNDMIAVQTELVNKCTEKFTSNLTETSDILKTAQDELSGLIDGAVADAKENAEKVMNLSKQGVAEATKATKGKKKAA